MNKFDLYSAMVDIESGDRERRRSAIKTIRKHVGPCNEGQWVREKFDSLTPDRADGWLSAYGFYAKDEDFRIAMIGKSFKSGNGRCYVIGLSDDQFNYGAKQGLLYLVKRDNWFKVGAISPDDLDEDLEFSDTSCYEGVKELLESSKFESVTYREVLKYIRSEFPSGEIY